MTVDPDATATKFDWVVFDLGGVVLQTTEAISALAGAMGIDPHVLESAYYLPRVDYDRDSDATRYWRSIATACGAAEPSAGLVADLVNWDDIGWSTVDPVTIAVIDDLAPTGVRLAVLSNAPSSMGRLIEAADWASVFDVLVFSGDLGVIKPDPGIYRILLERLGASADRTVFLDDRMENVAGARSAGIHAIHFENATQARRELRALGIPIPPFR